MSAASAPLPVLAALKAPISTFALRGVDLPVLALYALGFGLLHWAALPWSGGGFFSLWYPAAGLRFAVLWNRGARLTPWLMAVEVLTDVSVGVFSLAGPEVLQAVSGAIRPALTCGVAIAAVRRLAYGGTDALALPPMTLGLAAVAAPALNALMVLPVEAFLPADAGRYRMGASVVIALTGLAVGDLLGILVLAPLLLWLAALLQDDPAHLASRGAAAAAAAAKHLQRLPVGALLADALVLSLCLLLMVAFWQAGLGMRPTPGLLAGAWVGLRHGRVAAWLAILVQLLAFLPYSAMTLDDTERLTLHLGIAGTVLVTWLAGSFADAQAAARTMLDRRNRLLFQAERLKTLRSMSVAVIHEISQPLSTLAIEAGHLREATAGLCPDIAQSAELVDRKARALSDLIRRLRRFGGRDVDEPSPLPVAMLLQTARQIVEPELHAAGTRLTIALVGPDLVVQVQEIELTQALVNLLRNALAASPGETVALLARADGDEVRIEVVNPIGAPEHSGPDMGSGMGVGLVIARTIVEAHGGTLVRGDLGGAARFVVSLPLVPPPLSGHSA